MKTELATFYDELLDLTFLGEKAAVDEALAARTPAELRWLSDWHDMEMRKDTPPFVKRVLTQLDEAISEAAR